MVEVEGGLLLAIEINNKKPDVCNKEVLSAGLMRLLIKTTEEALSRTKFWEFPKFDQ